MKLLQQQKVLPVTAASALAGAGGAGFPYGGLGSLLWAYHGAYTEHFTDTGGTTPANDGQAIQSIKNLTSEDSAVRHGSASADPTYDTSLFGGVGGLQFVPNSGLVMNTDPLAIPVADQQTLYVVAQPENVGGQNRRLAVHMETDPGREGFGVSPVKRNSFTDLNELIFANQTNILMNEFSDAPHHWTAATPQSSFVTSTLWRDRTQLGTEDGQTWWGETIFHKLCLGSPFSNAVNNEAGGALGCALLYDGEHDAAQKAAVWDQLENDFGI